MLLEHNGERPKVHPTAYIAPNATLCGDVTVSKDSRVMFGAVLTAEGGPMRIGDTCVVMENALIRGTKRHPTNIGDNCVVGPRTHLVGCQVGTTPSWPPALPSSTARTSGKAPRCASTAPCT